METLSKRVKFGFGVGDLGGNLFFTIIGFYLLYFLIDIVGLSPMLAGTVLMIGKLWDAISDPIVGHLSDKTQSRWGRRRPYIFVGSFLALFGMYALFTVPNTDNTWLSFALMTFFFCFMSTAYTLINIPYTALLPALSNNFDQRTILSAYRMSFAVFGTFLGAGAVLPIIGLFPTVNMGWSMMGGIMGAIIMLSSLLTVFAIREPHVVPKQQDGFFKTCRHALSQPIFLKAVIPWLLFMAGTTMIQGVLVYYFKYIYRDESLFQIAMIVLLSFNLVCIPIWTWLSKRWDKKTCYIIGISIMGIALPLFSFLGEQLGIIWAFVTLAIGGIGLSTHYVMPHSILPDLAEYDAQNNNGLRREGMFSSLWTFASKIGQAFSLALNGWLLSIFRYDPGVSPERFTLTGIKLICGIGPILFFIAGIIIFSSYPITRKFYATMMKHRQ